MNNPVVDLLFFIFKCIFVTICVGFILSQFMPKYESINMNGVVYAFDTVHGYRK